MNKKIILYILQLSLISGSTDLAATPLMISPSPLGWWRTYDLEEVPRSIVHFYLSHGELQGKIVKNISTKKYNASDLCEKCNGYRKNKSTLGMIIIWGLTLKNGLWVNGRVLDTNNGKIYRCQLSVSQDNHTLYLHAYIAIPVLGKTVNWLRVNSH